MTLSRYQGCYKNILILYIHYRHCPDDLLREIIKNEIGLYLKINISCVLLPEMNNISICTNPLSLLVTHGRTNLYNYLASFLKTS
jgi:hypothetical protein